MASKKYYWLKLNKDFFKRHEIKIIESMSNGKDYVILYLKMLLESVSHEGRLRFSDTIPYSDEMLSAITGTNVDIVRSAMKVFIELKMVELLDDETIYMTEVAYMVGSETEEAVKKRIQRSKKGQIGDNVPKMSPQSIEYRDKSIDIREKNKDIISSNEDIPAPKKEVKHKYGEYNHVLLTDTECEKLFDDYGQAKTLEAIKYLDEYIEMKGYKARNHNLCLRKWVFDAIKEKSKRNSKPTANTIDWDNV